MSTSDLELLPVALMAAAGLAVHVALELAFRMEWI